MNSNTPSATAAVAQHNTTVSITSYSPPPRAVEEARVVYLMRRLKVRPEIAAAVAPLMFGSARQ